MASESTIPPQLFNCASGICCDSVSAAAATAKILLAAGCPEGCVADVVRGMTALGVAFAPVSLMAEISKLADHPDRR